MSEKIILLHGYGQFDGYCRAEILANEKELKNFLKKYDTCPTLAFKVKESDIVANHEQLMEMRNND